MGCEAISYGSPRQRQFSIDTRVAMACTTVEWKGRKGGSDEERGWLKRTDLPTGRMFYERKMENVVLRDVVTEAAKQINPVKRQTGRRGR